jgi:hypothetical protein
MLRHAVRHHVGLSECKGLRTCGRARTVDSFETTACRMNTVESSGNRYRGAENFVQFQRIAAVTKGVFTLSWTGVALPRGDAAPTVVLLLQGTLVTECGGCSALRPAVVLCVIFEEEERQLAALRAHAKRAPVLF